MLKFQHFGYLMQTANSLEKILTLGMIKGKRRCRGWDGWITSPTQWTWVWVSSRSWWWTGKPGMLRSMGLQKVGHNWATELNWLNCLLSLIFYFLFFVCVVYWDIAAAAQSLQPCPTLCNPIDGSPPGFPVSGILQARTLEWVAISFSNAWKWEVKVKSFSHVQLLATPWTAAHQAPPSMGFSRQEYWSGVPMPSAIGI